VVSFRCSLISFMSSVVLTSTDVSACCMQCCQIATVGRVFLFDILSLGGELSFDAGLRAVMQSTRLQKVCTVALLLDHISAVTEC